MKYIRTKDGRIIDTTKTKVSLGYHPIEANTIEELCDRWVAVYDDNICYQIGYFYIDGEKQMTPPLKQTNPINQKPIKVEIYGAIWTDKGLIYVAKMNEKGELELL